MNSACPDVPCSGIFSYSSVMLGVLPVLYRMMNFQHVTAVIYCFYCICCSSSRSRHSKYSLTVTVWGKYAFPFSPIKRNKFSVTSSLLEYSDRSLSGLFSQVCVIRLFSSFQNHVNKFQVHLHGHLLPQKQFPIFEGYQIYPGEYLQAKYSVLSDPINP